MPYLQPLEFNECIIDSPAFREKLLNHEKEIENSYKVFKDIYNSIKSVFKTLEDCSTAFNELADNLNKYINREEEMLQNTEHAKTEDEKIIKNAMTMYSDMISNIEMMRNEHILGATKTLIIEDLQKLKDTCLSKSKQETKEFRKVTANYYSKLEKFAAIKYKSDGDFKNVDSEIAEDRQHYVSRALDYVINIQETEEQKTCKLVHTLSLLIQMLNTYHHQAWDHFGDQKKKVDQINCALYRTEENYNTIMEKVNTLKQQKLSVPLENLHNDSSDGTDPRREGYLFVYTKKTVMSDMWTRNFCTYQKGSKKLTLTPYNQSSQVSVSKLQPEEVVLMSCERKKSNSVDRRFCFDIKVCNRPNPITLQALSSEDLKQWLHIMDGKEPIYAKMNIFGTAQEIETQLNERGMKFLQSCINIIEKRGLETPGIYRTNGNFGLCDKTIKRIADELRISSNKDVITDRELDAIDQITMCCMVKSYIKFLRIPMGTYALYDDFISAGKMQNPEDRCKAIGELIKKLPSDHFQLFSLVFHHLYKVAQFEEKNRMTAPNLAVCFSPTIFRPEQGTTSLTAIRESKFAGDVITVLIEKSGDFFPVPDPVARSTRLAPSKSMYMSRATAGDDILNADLTTKSQLDLQNFNENPSTSDNTGQKTIQKWNRTEHKSSDPSSNISRSVSVKPPILHPKPDISKYAINSPATSPQLSPLPRVPRKLDAQKIQQFDGNTRQRSLKRAKTLYVYVAENESQLSFDPNKIVINVSESEDTGWILGTIDGKVGLIPKSYVEILPT